MSNLKYSAEMRSTSALFAESLTKASACFETLTTASEISGCAAISSARITSPEPAPYIAFNNAGLAAVAPTNTTLQSWVTSHKVPAGSQLTRSEEHTSELQSLQ